MKRIVWLSLLTLASLLACGPGAPRRDAGTDATQPVDASYAPPVLVTAALPDPSDPVLPSSPRPADMSCLGTRMRPARTETVPYPFVLYDRVTNDPLPGLCAHVYLGPIAADDACAASDPRSGADGSLMIEVPGPGPFHLRLFAHPGITALDSYEDTMFFEMMRPPPDLMGRPVTGSAFDISTAGINELALAGGVVRDPTRATVGAFLADCRGHAVYGAEMRLFRADDTPISADASGTRLLYADGMRVFSATQPWTHVDGVAAMANVEVRTPGEIVRVEFIGRLHAQDAPRIVGCEEVQLVAGGAATVTPLGPLRMDGPTCPPLSP